MAGIHIQVMLLQQREMEPGDRALEKPRRLANATDLGNTSEHKAS